MNAAEAAKTAKRIREERAAASEEARKVRERKEAADWRKERADFLVEFRKYVEDYIATAVKAGKSTVKIEYLAGCGGSRNPVEAEECYKNSLLRDLVDKVFAHFRGKGFSIKTETFSHEHYCNYDTSDEMYHTYTVGAVISWKEE
jgi:hypothetical protein